MYDSSMHHRGFLQLIQWQLFARIAENDDMHLVPFCRLVYAGTQAARHAHGTCMQEPFTSYLAARKIRLEIK